MSHSSVSTRESKSAPARSFSDRTDVRINLKSNCNIIIPLQRFGETGERDYEGGLGLSAFKKSLTKFVSARHFHNALRIELFSETYMM